MTVKKTKKSEAKAVKATKVPKRKRAETPPAPEEATPAPGHSVPDPAIADAPANGKAEKLSALDAAARVLAEAHGTMNCKEMIGAMAAKGYWSSPGGKTPHATLYSAILREITVKGQESRFTKAARGRFGLTAPA